MRRGCQVPEGYERMDAIQSCWVNVSSSVPIPRLQKHAREGAPQCWGIKRASKEPKEGLRLRKSRGIAIGARNPCRIEYMGVYEILILPGGSGVRSKNARSRWRLLRRKTNQLWTKEEGRVVKPPPFFCSPLSPLPRAASYANSN